MSSFFSSVREALGIAPVDRFTVDYLRHLLGILERNPVVTPSNVEAMVETVRAAELAAEQPGAAAPAQRGAGAADVHRVDATVATVAAAIVLLANLVVCCRRRIQDLAHKDPVPDRDLYDPGARRQ